ncbi:MAG: plasmid mobilization relaxosome protein MobC [Candidatus Thiodiazotropha sp. (ex Lucinoma kastoroae)]|nr:plasmid mobilization relaxosome protein MobC [Candidatus Thiodiazotropha sp. (ex Lucinoma kastoroae)]
MDRQVSTKRTPPFSLRLSVDERSEIERRSRAAGLSIAGYFKSAALNRRPRKFRHPQVDRKELARLLGQLGRVGNNLNQLSRTLNAGSSIEIPELMTALKDLADMRAMVMSALGYRETTEEAGADKQGHHHDY